MNRQELEQVRIALEQASLLPTDQTAPDQNCTAALNAMDALKIINRERATDDRLEQFMSIGSVTYLNLLYDVLSISECEVWFPPEMRITMNKLQKLIEEYLEELDE